MTPKLSHIIGFLAIVVGAIATFDSSMLAIVRYLLIYFAILTITAVVLHSVYGDVDESPSLDKVKDKV